MEKVYKGYIQNNDLSKDIELEKMNWLYSKKKYKFYFKYKIEEGDTIYEIIGFKNNYCLIFKKEKAIKQIDDIEFPDGRYPRLGL